MVSATLLEMNVAMPFSIFDFRFPTEASNPRERQTGKFPGPAQPQAGALALNDGQEQLIVFAVVQRLRHRAAAIPRKKIFVHFKSNAARARQSRQICAQSVAEVDHGMNRKILGEPASFFNSRRELEMFAAERST